MVAPSGYDIVEADSGMAAMRCLDERSFAAILMDVRMPVMDGYTTAALIRKRKNLDTTPIIFVTENDRDLAAEARGYAMGAVDFVFAPLQPEELRSKVDAMVNRFTQTETLVATAHAI